ncbi:MAG: imidazole glycerol phosphate synthase cyclase subunit [Bdellovibrionota bacterium]
MLRIIPRLDIKWPNLIKSIQLEGLRVLGDPSVFAQKYYNQGADELILMDCVASLYNRNSLNDLIKVVVEKIFIPITVGGGIRTVDDARNILRSGADKVAINTAAIANPNLISELANQFGSQAVVVSIEAKQIEDSKWISYFDNGRENSALDVIEWAQKAEKLGAGEILLTSVDKEGTGVGFNSQLIRAVSSVVTIPIIASGGMGQPQHAIEAVNAGANAIASARILHYNHNTIDEVKRYCQQNRIEVRI